MTRCSRKRRTCWRGPSRARRARSARIPASSKNEFASNYSGCSASGPDGALSYYPSSWRSNLVAASALSRRISEFTGVALFAAALLWLISLVTYSPSDPVWFFNNVGSQPGNFAGRFGAFLAEVSFQLVGYSSFLLPLAVGFVAWHRFWCKDVDAEYTKLVGSVLLVLSVASLLGLAAGASGATGRRFGPGGMLGEWLSAFLSAYLNRTGAAILLLTCLALAIVLSTQFSFGRAATVIATRMRERGGLLTRFREWRDERERVKERQATIEKHVKRAGKDKAPGISGRAADAAEKLKAARAKTQPESERDDEEEEDEEIEAPPRPKPPTIKRAAPTPVAQSLPLSDPEPKAPAERRKGAYMLPPLTLLDPPKDQR